MLFKLAFRNIRKSIKDYTVYFLTLMFAVSIFYMFNSIEGQKAILKLSESSNNTVETLISAIDAVSVFIAIVLGLLIVYANNFLIKRRKKEFGIYMTLGMGKIKISGLILLETVIIGLISLAVGLVVGVFLSQHMSVLMEQMFEADLTEYTFIFSKSALIKTCIYFAIMYFAAITFSTIAISRYRLINLLNADRKNEKIKIKNPVVCIVIFLVSCAALGVAYWMVTGGLNMSYFNMEYLSCAVILGIVGTFLLFWSVAGFLLNIIKASKKIYLKNTNMFVLKQFNNKINSTFIGMSLISIMLFVTICALSVSISYNVYSTEQFYKAVPVDVNIMKMYPIDEDSQTVEETGKEKDKSIVKSIQENGFDINSLKDISEITIYYIPTTIDEYLGEDITKDITDYEYYGSTEETVIKVSDYNKIAKLYGLEQVSVKEDEYAIIARDPKEIQINNKALQNGNKISVNGKTYKPAYSKCINGFYDLQESSDDHIGTIIVPDSCPVTYDNVFNKLLAANYNCDSIEEKNQINEELRKVPSYGTDDIYYSFTLRQYLLAQSVGTSSIMTFLSLYIGMTFLITSAAILTLKQLTESADNKQRYTILRKIGCDEKMINKALFKQIGIFFLLPVLVACIHSIFGLSFAFNIMSSFVNFNEIAFTVILTFISLIIIYGIYFVVTYFAGKRIIKDHNQK